MRKYSLIRNVLILILAGLTGGIVAQQPTGFEVFASDSIMHVRLTTDIKLLVKKKFDEIYQPATLEIQRPGDTLIVDVQIRSRGNIRKEVCYYPPIKIKFPKEDYSYNKVKWVNACNDKESFDQILLKEFLAYRIFESLTPKSFRTYLLEVEYVDTGRDNETYTQHAFVIEPDDRLADRLGGRVYEPKVMKDVFLASEQLALFTMFQYMIANTDWAFANRHNMEIVTSPETNTLLPIPYDFDYSGFVHPHYAHPHESVPIDDVAERYNKSYCMTELMCKNTSKYIVEHTEAILAACDHVPHLSKRTLKFTKSFIKQFLKLINNERTARRIFAQNCITMPVK